MSEEKQDKNRWVDSISLLIKLTQQGKLEWRSATEPELPNDADRVSAVFVTDFKDKTLRLYERRVEVRYDPRTIAAQYLSQTKDTEWVQRPVLEFINTKGDMLWRFPSTGALADLMSIVQYRVAGVKEFLAEIEALAS